MQNLKKLKSWYGSPIHLGNIFKKIHIFKWLCTYIWINCEVKINYGTCVVFNIKTPNNNKKKGGELWPIFCWLLLQIKLTLNTKMFTHLWSSCVCPCEKQIGVLLCATCHNSVNSLLSLHCSSSSQQAVIHTVVLDYIIIQYEESNS